MRTSRACPAYVPVLLTLLPLGIALAVLWQGMGDSRAVAAFFAAHRAAHPLLAGLFHVVSDWGNPAFYVVYATLLWRGWRGGDRRRVRFVLTYIVVQLLVSFALVRVLKIAIGAPRPDASGFNRPGSLSGSYNSMPSGHTTEIVGAALPLAVRARNLIVPALLGLMVLAVGFSRVYLGRHHPADVLCGMLLGCWAGLVITTVAGGGLRGRSAATATNGADSE